MTDQEHLEATFEALGLSQYLDAFVDQGFDTWETILYIQEQDFDALGVKLGHRRKLQQRIDEWRKEQQVRSSFPPLGETGDGTSRTEPLRREGNDGQRSGPGAVQKRKYRRHPKPDSNAPERPPSAYVLFSNKVRDELKGQALDFSEIAKMVGVRWQRLSQSERQPFEAKAQQSKEKYNRELLEYQKSPEFRHYQQYLDEFKKKHPQSQDATKRTKVESAKKTGTSNGHRDEQNGASTGAHVAGVAPATASPTVTSRRPIARTAPSTSELDMPPARRQRIDSNVSQAEAQFAAMPTPPTSHYASVDDSVISPKSTQFDDGNGALVFAGNGRKSRSSSLRDEGVHSRPLPSLSNMIPDDTLPRLTESPTLVDPNTTGSLPGQISRPVWTQHGMVSQTYGPHECGTTAPFRDAPQTVILQQRLSSGEYSNYTASSASPATISTPGTNPSVASSTLGGGMPIHALLSSSSSPSLLQRTSKSSPKASFASRPHPGHGVNTHSPPMGNGQMSSFGAADRSARYSPVDNSSPTKTPNGTGLHASWHGVPLSSTQTQYWQSADHSASPISEPGRTSVSPVNVTANQVLPERYAPPQPGGLIIETTLSGIGSGQGAGANPGLSSTARSQHLAETAGLELESMSGREGLDALLQAAGELQKRIP